MKAKEEYWQRVVEAVQEDSRASASITSADQARQREIVEAAREYAKACQEYRRNYLDTGPLVAAGSRLVDLFPEFK